MAETRLHQAQRHVREGDQRILRQAVVIARLKAEGHISLLPSARELLDDMQALQHTARRHLQRLESERRD